MYRNEYTGEIYSREELNCQFYDDIQWEGDYNNIEDWLQDEGYEEIED